MTGGMAGGHFAGFFLALLGLAVLTVVSTRPSVVRKLGANRARVIAVSILICILMAIFGNGTREIFFRTVVGPNEQVLTRVTQAHVDTALREVLRPEFVRYMERLEALPPLADGARIADALSVRVGTTVDLLAEGHSIEPPPKLGQTYLFVSYSDRENALLSIFRGDAGVRRMALTERIVTRVLPQAAAIAALRAAENDREKLAILNENPFVVPYAAEWIVAELDKLAAGASPEVALVLAQKRAYVQKYVENPAARDIHAEGRIDPP